MPGTVRKSKRLAINHALLARIVPVIRARYGTGAHMLRAAHGRVDWGRWQHVCSNETYPRPSELVALSDLLDVPYAELDALCPVKGAEAANDDDEAHAA